MPQEKTFTVRPKQHCGTYGPKSNVAGQLDLPTVHGPSNGLVISLSVEANLKHLAEHNRSLLHYFYRPSNPQSGHGVLGIAHFIRPWKSLGNFPLPHPSYKEPEATEERILARMKEIVGDDRTEYKVREISTWSFNEVYTMHYSPPSRNVHGNSVHRHPPFGKLCISICIEDPVQYGLKDSIHAARQSEQVPA